MDLMSGQLLDSEHNHCIISLVNKIVAKSPHLTALETDPVLFQRLVSVINLIESTLCSKDQIVLKRNSTDSQSIDLIKSWLHKYYKREAIVSLCRTIPQVTTGGDPNDNVVEDTSDYTREDIDRDIGLICLLVLFIAHKLKQSLPRIKAYFLPEWQTLSRFDSNINQMVNFDKLLDLIQNELCIKRKELEITRSKLLSFKSVVNHKNLSQNSDKKSKLDFRSNLFAEYEDNETEEANDSNVSDGNEELSGDDESPTFVDHSSDEDFEPKNKITRKSHKYSIKRSKRPQRRARTSSDSPKKSSEQNSRLTSSSLSVDGESENHFECEVCGKQFVKEYRLTRHSYTHLGHKQFVCDYPDCNESFDLKWKLSEHKSEHNGGEEEETSYASSGHSFECEWADCRQVFQTKRELTAHEHDMHANRSQSKYSCDWPQCREIFENKIDWRKHVRTHGKIRPTDCGFPGCDKTFYKLDSLESHRKVHQTFTLEELP